MATPQASGAGYNCSICLNSFQIPKALPCLHTFCQECLQCYVDKTFNRKDKSFLCPLCRTVCKPSLLFPKGNTILVNEIASHLPTNFYIKSAEPEVKSKISNNNCDDKPLDKTKNYLYEIEALEKQIYDRKKQIEEQYRLNMIWAHTLKQGIKFCPQDNSANGLECQVEITLKKKCENYQKNHNYLDCLLLDLKSIKEDVISHLTQDNILEAILNPKKTKKSKKNPKKPSGNEVYNFRQNLTEFKSNMEKTFVKLTISEAKSELKILMEKMQLLWISPAQEEGSTKPSLFLKTASQGSNGLVFPKVNEFLYICSVKVINDDTVIICGTSPNLLICYDADSGLMKSSFELCDEPRSMSVFNDTDVMVTFLNETRIDIINVFGRPTIIKTIKTEKLYLQALCLDAERKKILALSLKKRTYAYDVLQISTESSIAVLGTGRIQGLSSGSRLAYIKQRDIVLYPDKTRKCLMGFCLSSEKVVFKYYGDLENPLVLISDICCSESFIFIADRRHHKVHKLDFCGSRLDIIKCHDFNMMWPLHIHVNRNRTMVICYQRKDTSYEIKTLLI